MNNAITSKEFRDRVKSQESIADLKVIKDGYGFSLTEQPEILNFVFSTKETDLAGDRVFPDGVDITNYMARNPLILLHHDTHTFPIGKTLDLSVVDDRLIGSIEFFTDLDEANVGTQARAAVELIKRGTMGLSITFIPKDFELNTTDGLDFKKTLLLETSVVTVPCNPSSFHIPDPVVPQVVTASAPDGLVSKNRELARARQAAWRHRAICLAE